MNKLKLVIINRESTCLSYVIDRKGITNEFKTVNNIPKNKFTHFNFSNVKIGDIVAWKNDIPIKLYKNTITQSDNGYPLILETPVETAFHLGIVEYIDEYSNIIISDCTRKLNTNGYPEIRLRYFSINPIENETRLPDFKLNL